MSESMVLERLARLEPDWADVEQRSRRLHTERVLRKTALSLLGLAAAAILAGGAYAAARTLWSGHDMTPADIERQATTVYNDRWSECDGHGHCKDVSGAHKEVDIVPSMGVSFVLPDGDVTSIVPGAGNFIPAVPAAGMPAPAGHPPRDDSGNSWGTAHLVRDAAGDLTGGVWSVPLPGGGERTIAWTIRTGAVTATDSRDGNVTTTRLQAGDVVALVPGSVANQPRTLDKAVSFELPTEGFMRVIIFPRLNETYVDFVHGPPMSRPLPYGAAAKYGLTPIGDYNGKLPVSPSGGTWTVHLHGLTSVVSWHAGDSFVTVENTTSAGTSTTRVPIGHELPLIPFK